MKILSALSPSRREDCPSDFVLSEYDARVLSDAERLQVEAHVQSCPRCNGWLEEGREAFFGLEVSERRRMIDAMHEASQRSKRVRFPMRAVSGAIAAAAAALLVFVALPRGDRPENTSKGAGLALRVYLEREGRVTKALSGETFHPKDRLRFEVDLPKGGNVMIVGEEESGRVYGCFPNNGVSRALPSGDRQLLQDAVELDESMGRETIELVVCPEPFSIDQVRRSIGSCQTTTFRLEKRSP